MLTIDKIKEWIDVNDINEFMDQRPRLEQDYDIKLIEVGDCYEDSDTYAVWRDNESGRYFRFNCYYTSYSGYELKSIEFVKPVQVMVTKYEPTGWKDNVNVNDPNKEPDLVFVKSHLEWPSRISVITFRNIINNEFIYITFDSNGKYLSHE